MRKEKRKFKMAGLKGEEEAKRLVFINEEVGFNGKRVLGWRIYQNLLVGIQ